MSSKKKSDKQKVQIEPEVVAERKDTEFDAKLHEMQKSESNIDHIKTIWTNFHTNTKGLKTLCQDIYQNLEDLYKKDSPYYSAMGQIIEVHKEVEKLYDTLDQQIGKLSNGAENWNVYFSEIKGCLSERDDIKEKLDRYDVEFEKFIDELNVKEEVSETDVAEFKKAELKYRTTAENFCKISKYTFHLMSDLVDFKANFVNPILTNVIFILYFSFCWKKLTFSRPSAIYLKDTKTFRK